MWGSFLVAPQVALVTLSGAPPPSTSALSSFTLVNADSDLDPGPLTSGMTLNLATLPTRTLNVRAYTTPAVVGSVRFGYDGNAAFASESTAPYALAGDTAGNYNPWPPAVGNHSLGATPYGDAGGGGSAGTSLTITFSVVDPLTAADVSIDPGMTTEATGGAGWTGGGGGEGGCGLLGLEGAVLLATAALRSPGGSGRGGARRRSP